MTVTIRQQDLIESIASALQYISYYHPADYIQHLARAYEREHFKFTEANARVGSATRDLFLSWLPAPSRPIAKQAVYAMLDDELLEAFGFLKPNAAFKAMVRASLRARGRAMRLLPARTTPWFLTMQPSRTYPKGYQIDDLGPPDFLAKERAAREAGAQEQKAQKEQNPQ